MEYTFDLISAEEHDRLRARYEPFTEARGHLIDAEGVTVDAERVFIMPTWAREAG